MEKNWLKVARVCAGLRQIDVCKRVGMSQQHYSRIERGLYADTLPPRTAKRIAVALGFPWTRFYDDSAENGGTL
ncbi:hypothetical protein FACS18949_18330 [Clostridia bacterium]|nr:hypothetical protein FACS189425_04740 [Clostridia bacterium]GHV38074.1 hypothetical protein FACS18949_18330 [Clostridia bacterium]